MHCFRIFGKNGSSWVEQVPVLRNSKHEAFAQALAKGKSADAAYSGAGFKPHRQNASRLMANDDIRARVAEIKSRVAEKAEWSAADRLRGLKAIYDASLADDRRTAISAISEANKMQGSYAPSKHQHTGPNGGPIQTVDLSHLSEDDLSRLETILGPLAGAAGDNDEGDTGGEG